MHRFFLTPRRAGRACCAAERYVVCYPRRDDDEHTLTLSLSLSSSSPPSRPSPCTHARRSVKAAKSRYAKRNNNTRFCFFFSIHHRSEGSFLRVSEGYPARAKKKCKIFYFCRRAVVARGRRLWVGAYEGAERRDDDVGNDGARYPMARAGS